MNQEIKTYHITVRRFGHFIKNLPIRVQAIEGFIRDNVAPRSAFVISEKNGKEVFGDAKFNKDLSYPELRAEAELLGYTFDQEEDEL